MNYSMQNDIILGGHPHVVQPMEVRKIIRSDGTEETGFVIYSLGNYISSQRTPLILLGMPE